MIPEIDFDLDTGRFDPLPATPVDGAATVLEAIKWCARDLTVIKIMVERARQKPTGSNAEKKALADEAERIYGYIHELQRELKRLEDRANSFRVTAHMAWTEKAHSVFWKRIRAESAEMDRGWHSEELEGPGNERREK